jgi:hypothetical protein
VAVHRAHRADHRAHRSLRSASIDGARLILSSRAGCLAKPSGGAQTTLQLLLLERGAPTRGLSTIPLGHGGLLSSRSSIPRLRHRGASVHMICGASQ